MSFMDYDLAKVHLKAQYNHQRHHTMATDHVPTYVNRSVPTYSIKCQKPISQANDLASPRYSPNVQPWRRKQAQSSLSFIPFSSPEQSEYTTSQPKRPGDRGTACVSPFRSVRRMKEPFQLRLPSSPFENGSPPSRELRPSPRTPGNRTLRAWRSDQNLASTSLETFGLLPSPPLSDCWATQPLPSPTYFFTEQYPGPESDQEFSRSCNCHAGKSCGVCQANSQANHAKNQNDTCRATNVHLAHSNLIKQYESEDEQFTPRSTTDSECIGSPVAFSDLGSPGKKEHSGSSVNMWRSRSGTVSSEGSWVPSSLSHCETWLQGAPLEGTEVKDGKLNGANRRKCQIVQKSPLILDWKRAPDDVMFAVASKTKPKLVDISRQSSPAMSCSAPTASTIIPSTPDITQPEISAFSPDTPMEISDSGYATRNSPYSPEGFRGIKEEDEATEPNSVTLGSIGETIVSDKPPIDKQHPNCLPKLNIKPQSSPRMQASPGDSANNSEQEELEKWWDHEWTIDQLEHSVKDFPRNMPRLTSPVIMFIRHSQEKVLIRHFCKIFPAAPENLLDCLCAALVARNYVVSSPLEGRRAGNLSPRSNLPRLATVPEKGSSILGMKLSQLSSSQIQDRTLGSRIAKLQNNLDRMVDHLLSTISSLSDEKLKAAVLVLIQVLEART